MPQFRLQYKLLGHGWAEAVASAADRSCEITVSYLSDALGDLARAALACTLKTDELELTFSFFDEPGEYRWAISRAGDQVRISIVEFDDYAPKSNTVDGKLIFEAACSLRRFVSQVRGLLQSIHNEVGVLKYKEQWKNHDFPKTELDGLTSWLKQEPHAA